MTLRRHLRLNCCWTWLYLCFIKWFYISNRLLYVMIPLFRYTKLGVCLKHFLETLEIMKREIRNARNLKFGDDFTINDVLLWKRGICSPINLAHMHFKPFARGLRDSQFCSRFQRTFVIKFFFWIREEMLAGWLSSKCVCTGSKPMNVLLHIPCTAFYINVRAGMPGYWLKLECWWSALCQRLHSCLIQL